MNKAKLVESMAKMTKMSKSHCKDALEAFISSVSGALKQNKDPYSPEVQLLAQKWINLWMEHRSKSVSTK